jgi:hypothetical protein
MSMKTDVIDLTMESTAAEMVDLTMESTAAEMVDLTMESTAAEMVDLTMDDPQPTMAEAPSNVAVHPATAMRRHSIPMDTVVAIVDRSKSTVEMLQDLWKAKLEMPLILGCGHDNMIVQGYCFQCGRCDEDKICGGSNNAELEAFLDSVGKDD